MDNNRFFFFFSYFSLFFFIYFFWFFPSSSSFVFWMSGLCTRTHDFTQDRQKLRDGILLIMEEEKEEEEDETTTTTTTTESPMGSPRTVALRHFKDDRLLQSARLLRSYCLDDFDDDAKMHLKKKNHHRRREGGGGETTTTTTTTTTTSEEEEEKEKEKEKDKEKERLVAYVLQKAKQSESFMDMLREDAEKDASWETQKSLSFSLTSSLSSSSSQKSREQTKIYYKTIENDTKLIVRVDQSIKRDMLVPVLATLNESQLYASWLPSWTMPKLKFSRTEKLDQRGRCSQLLLVTVECPWPFSTREVVLDALAFDDIDESGVVAVLLNSCDCEDDERVPAIDHKFGQCTRVDFHGGFLFRAIPSEGDAWKKAREIHGDEMIVSFIFNIDPKISYVPVSIIQFVTRTVIGTLWAMFMKIANKVKNGEMKEHAKAIESKRLVLYDWVDERVKIMFARIF